MTHDVELVEQDRRLRRFVLSDVAEGLPHIHHGELDFAALFEPQPVVELVFLALDKAPTPAAEAGRYFRSVPCAHAWPSLSWQRGAQRKRRYFSRPC
jgi:hypothetical protein